MWCRWISNGVFDGKPSSPQDLARYLADAHKERLSGWDPVNEALRAHVRSYLRSGDKNNVDIALQHIQAAADARAPVLVALLDEANGVSGTAEWDDWKKRDRETVEWWGWYVHLVAKEARADRDWLKAWNGADRMVDFAKMRRQILAKDKTDGDRGA